MENQVSIGAYERMNDRSKFRKVRNVTPIEIRSVTHDGCPMCGGTTKRGDGRDCQYYGRGGKVQVEDMDGNPLTMVVDDVRTFARGVSKSRAYA